MSLTHFIKTPEVRAKLAALRPKFPRKLSCPLRVVPRSNRSTMIGTAFDYLLRFELQRRAPWALARAWVAERMPDMLCPASGSIMPLAKNERGIAFANPLVDRPDAPLTREVAEAARRVLAAARSAHTAFLICASPARPEYSALAAHTVRLAKLDVLPRSGQLDATFEEAAPEDVEDLLDLLALVPFHELIHDKVLLLNPTFGETSRLMGGADVDLISGEMLVDIKTTKGSEIEAPHLDQLLGYLLLARHQRHADPTFPAINRLAIYFARHGYLWPLDASLWTNHRDFVATETWFFDRVAQG